MEVEVMMLGGVALLLLLSRLTDDFVLVPALKSTEAKGREGQGYTHMDTLNRPPNPLDQKVNKSPLRPIPEYDRTRQPQSQTTMYIDPVTDTKSRPISPEVYAACTKGNMIFG